MSVCRIFSCVVGRGHLPWPVRSLGKTLLAFALLHSVLQGQTYLLLQVSLEVLLLHSNPLWWKGHLFLVLILEGLVGHHRIKLFPRVCSNSCPLSWWCHQPSHPLPLPFPCAFNLFQHGNVFQWVASSHLVNELLELQFQHQGFELIFKVDLL